MTTKSAARAEIMSVVAVAAAAWSAYPLVVDAEGFDDVDQATQVNPYLKVDLIYLDGHQLDLGEAPRAIQYGQIILDVVAKAGTGMLPTETLQDFLIPYFDMESLGDVQCHAASAHKGETKLGWEHNPIVVTFWYTRIKTSQ